MARWKLVTVLATNRLGAVERARLPLPGAGRRPRSRRAYRSRRCRTGVQAGIRSSQPPNIQAPAAKPVRRDRRAALRKSAGV
jgi:hypothetical protein